MCIRDSKETWWKELTEEETINLSKTSYSNPKDWYYCVFYRNQYIFKTPNSTQWLEEEEALNFTECQLLPWEIFVTSFQKYSAWTKIFLFIWDLSISWQWLLACVGEGWWARSEKSVVVYSEGQDESRTTKEDVEDVENSKTLVSNNLLGQ